MKVLFIGYYGAGNLGDELLLSENIKLLKNSFPQIEITVLSSSPENTFIQHKVKAFHKFKISDIFKALFQCKYLIFGGGSIFQDKSSFKSLFYYFCICLLAKLFLKKIIFISQGIGPFKTWFSELLARISFSFADSISIREGEDNIKFLKKWKLYKAPFQGVGGIDSAWSYSCSTEPTPKDKSLLISLRSDLKLTKAFLKKFILLLIKKYSNYKFNLIALQKCDLKEFNFLENYLKQYNINYEIFELYDIESLKQNEKIFLSSEKAFCMRFHALLLCIKYIIPCLGLVYDPKVEGLCKKANLPFISLESSNLEEKIFEEVEKINIQDLKDFVKKQEELIKRNIDFVKIKI